MSELEPNRDNQIKREELLAWHSVVTDWEVERYLTLF